MPLIASPEKVQPQGAINHFDPCCDSFRAKLFRIDIEDPSGHRAPCQISHQGSGAVDCPHQNIDVRSRSNRCDASVCMPSLLLVSRVEDGLK